jgi:hypothetical protein
MSEAQRGVPVIIGAVKRMHEGNPDDATPALLEYAMKLATDLPGIWEMLEGALTDHQGKGLILETQVMGISNESRLPVVESPAVQIDVIVPTILQRISELTLIASEVEGQPLALRHYFQNVTLVTAHGEGAGNARNARNA